MRWLILGHRYLGIALCLLMALWCCSGAVMMYVSYPQLSPATRLRGLEPVNWRECCVIGSRVLGDDDPVSRFEIEMLGGRPVIHLAVADHPPQTVDLVSGAEVGTLSPEEAGKVATTFGRAKGEQGTPQFAGRIDYDQWTVSGEFNRDRPLLRFDLQDSGRTQLYVSSRTGEVVQLTTAQVRFWNWLGAVPHWIYFASLRRQGQLWAQIVIYTSLLGSFLVVTGLYIGVRQFLRRPPGHWSPYRRILLWHHLPGLVFGILALTWVVSGLLSMNPWGLLENGGAQAEREHLHGRGITGSQLRQALGALAAGAPDDVVSVAAAPLHGQLYLIMNAASGVRWRVDAQGARAPLSAADLGHDAELLAAGAALADSELLAAEDNYYFSHHLDTVALPVYRVIVSDGQHTRYYIDPVSGELLGKIDRNGRGYRWLHEGLHRLDFTPVLRARPAWDVLMVLLLCGVGAICLTGAYLGMRRAAGRGPPRTGRRSITVT